MCDGAAAAELLAASGAVAIEPGLTDQEFTRVEEMLDFEFADDHRAFLAAGLPVGASWPQWRTDGRRSLQKRMQLPADGILFAVEWNEFWPADWGPRPARMKDALRSANYHLARVPRLVPLCSHHYLPAGRGRSGLPVLSVEQTHLNVLGSDLAGYIDAEFGTGGHQPSTSPTVEFWSTLVV